MHISRRRRSGGHSPLTPTMHVVLEYARSHPTTRRRVIILVTDGIADCNPDLDCNTCNCSSHDCCLVIPRSGRSCLDDTGPVAAIAALRSVGTETAVIGIRPDATPEAVMLGESVLSRCAAAGGFADVAWVHEGTVAAAIERAVSQSRQTCQFDVPQRPFGGQFGITVGSRPVVHDPADGWEWIGTTQSQIQLHGSSCQAYRDASSPRVSIAETSGSHCE